MRRSALPPVPGHVQTAALLVRGTTASGRFHLQVTASTHVAGSDEMLFRMIPDLDALNAQLTNQNPDWVTITFRGIGEMTGDKNAAIPNRCAQYGRRPNRYGAVVVIATVWVASTTATRTSTGNARRSALR